MLNNLMNLLKFMSKVNRLRLMLRIILMNLLLRNVLIFIERMVDNLRIGDTRLYVVIMILNLGLVVNYMNRWWCLLHVGYAWLLVSVVFLLMTMIGLVVICRRALGVVVDMGLNDDLRKETLRIILLLMLLFGSQVLLLLRGVLLCLS